LLSSLLQEKDIKEKKMAEIFLKEDANKILKGRKILFLGDSIMRNLYQDFVYLLQFGELVPHTELRKKGEQMPSFAPGDKLVEGTGVICTGRSYREVRHYFSSDISATYCFLTRCFSEELAQFMLSQKDNRGNPDVILVLSALWDINRWGPGGIKQYIKNCRQLLLFVRESFPSSTQLIWLTCPPISVDVTGGMLLEDLEFTKRSMRFNVMEANNMVAQSTAAHGYDVVDLHYWMTHQIHKRLSDGVHWAQDAVRMQLNIILTHLCVSRDLPLPNHNEGTRNIPLESVKVIAEAADSNVEENFIGKDEEYERFPMKARMDINANKSLNIVCESVEDDLKETNDMDPEEALRKGKRKRRNKFSHTDSNSSSDSLFS
jgi:hypothetical protein